MKQIVEQFDRAYIINLADREDRRKQTESEFRRIGINIPNDRVQFFTAVRPADKGRFSDIGTRGCFNSHRSILELAHQKGLQSVLICEDDISFRDVGASFEKQLIKALQEVEWDVVFLGYSVPDDEELAGPLIRWSKDILGAHFYAVNGTFIGKMLEYMNECEQRIPNHPLGGPMPADGTYNHIRYVKPDINFFIAAPNLAHQRSSRTDIAQTHLFDKVVSLRPAIQQARAIKHRLRMALDSIRLRRRLSSRQPFDRAR